MSPKQRLNVETALKSLESGAFATPSVRDFFLSLRESAGKESVVAEIGNFAAHQEGRGLGRVQRWVQLKAFQLRHIVASTQGTPTEPLQVNQLEKRFYEDVLCYAVKESRRWPMPNGMTQKDATSFLKSLYDPLGKSVFLRPVHQSELEKLTALFSHVLSTAEFADNPPLSLGKVHAATTELLSRFDARFKTAWRSRFDAVWQARNHEIGCCLIEIIHGVHYFLWNGEEVPTKVLHLDEGIFVCAEFPTAGPRIAVAVLATNVITAVHFPELLRTQGGTRGLVSAVRDGSGQLVLRSESSGSPN